MDVLTPQLADALGRRTDEVFFDLLLFEPNREADGHEATVAGPEPEVYADGWRETLVRKTGKLTQRGDEAEDVLRTCRRSRSGRNASARVFWRLERTQRRRRPRRRASSPATSCGRGGKRAGGALAGSGRAETTLSAQSSVCPRQIESPGAPLPSSGWATETWRQARGELESAAALTPRPPPPAPPPPPPRRQPGASAAAAAARGARKRLHLGPTPPPLPRGAQTPPQLRSPTDEAQKHQGHLLHRHQVSRTRRSRQQRPASRGAHQARVRTKNGRLATAGRRSWRPTSSAAPRGTGRARAGKPSTGQQRSHHADAAEELRPESLKASVMSGDVGALGGTLALLVQVVRRMPSEALPNCRASPRTVLRSGSSALSFVPRLRAKLNALLFARQFEALVHWACSSLRACRQVETSAGDPKGTLAAILRAVLDAGNVLNSGTPRGNAQGYKLDTLLKLRTSRPRPDGQVQTKGQSRGGSGASENGVITKEDANEIASPRRQRVWAGVAAAGLHLHGHRPLSNEAGGGGELRELTAELSALRRAKDVHADIAGGKHSDDWQPAAPRGSLCALRVLTLEHLARALTTCARPSRPAARRHRQWHSRRRDGS